MIAEEYEVYRYISDAHEVAYWAENERVRLRGTAWNLEVAAIRVRDAARALEEVLKVYETELGKIHARNARGRQDGSTVPPAPR